MRLARLISMIVIAAAAVTAQGDPRGKQEEARVRFEALHEAMQRLQVSLAETAPDESRALEHGNTFVQEARIHEQMAEVRELLADGRWDEALERMRTVQAKLEELLGVLLDRDLGLADLMKRIEQLEGFKERVDTLIDEQQAEKEAAARAEALQQHLADLERAQADLAALREGQEQLRTRANAAGMRAAPEEAADMAAGEKDLAERTAELAERTAELEKANERLTDPANTGEQASPPSGCSGACQSASAKMAQAEQKLGQNQPERSLEDMDAAANKLEQAAAALAQMTDEARRQLAVLPFDEQAAAQERTRIDTDKLAADMEQASEGEDGESKEPTPGTKNVQQAVPKQRAAAGQLKEFKPGKAKQEQQDAKEDLEAAQQELEDALAQLRQQLQDEVLRALEERFGAMLAKQKEISARTVVTDRLQRESLTASGAPSAAMIERCNGLSSEEAELASEAADALALLSEEGTTAVFPELVEELHDDLDRVALRLAERRTDTTTQRAQTAIEDLLTLLIDALRKTIEENESEGGGQCDGKPPLVPMSAELKLILALQKRVHERTVAFEDGTPAAERERAEVRDEAGEIARKQGRVEDLTRKLANKLNKENAEEAREDR